MTDLPRPPALSHNRLPYPNSANTQSGQPSTANSSQSAPSSPTEFSAFERDSGNEIIPPPDAAVLRLLLPDYPIHRPSTLSASREATPSRNAGPPMQSGPALSNPALSTGYPYGIGRDLEKQEIAGSPRVPRPDSSCSTLQERYTKYCEDEDHETFLQSNAMKILVYLSGIDVLVSLIIAIWTLLALLAVLLVQPLQFFRRRINFREQLIRLLSPGLRIQLCLIYSSRTAASYSATVLTLIHLLSPLVSIGVSAAAWTAAIFWLYAAILGDPNGSDRPRGYNDGKASVLGVRVWWEHWLTRALR